MAAASSSSAAAAAAASTSDLPPPPPSKPPRPPGQTTCPEPDCDCKSWYTKARQIAKPPAGLYCVEGVTKANPSSSTTQQHQPHEAGRCDVAKIFLDTEIKQAVQAKFGSYSPLHGGAVKAILEAMRVERVAVRVTKNGQGEDDPYLRGFLERFSKYRAGFGQLMEEARRHTAHCADPRLAFPPPGGDGDGHESRDESLGALCGRERGTDMDRHFPLEVLPRRSRNRDHRCTLVTVEKGGGVAGGDGEPAATMGSVLLEMWRALDRPRNVRYAPPNVAGEFHVDLMVQTYVEGMNKLFKTTKDVAED